MEKGRKSGGYRSAEALEKAKQDAKWNTAKVRPTYALWRLQE